jgi:hypothetical protein
MRAASVIVLQAAARAGTPSIWHLAADTPRADQPWLWPAQ